MNDQIFWSPGVTLDQIEKLVIKKALIHFRNNKAATASSLGVAVRTIDNKLERYEMEEREERNKEAERKRKDQEFLTRARGQYTMPTNHMPTPPAAPQVPVQQVTDLRAKKVK